MDMLKRHQPIDLAQFAPDLDTPHARYGLPSDVRFCKKCGISNQRPNAAKSEYALVTESPKATIRFNAGDICDACVYWEKKHKSIDWAEREHKLRTLCDRYRSRNGSWDCIVPGSGGKDSFVQSWLLRHKYGMNPLTITWAPQMYTAWGWENMQNWINSGFDNFIVTPNGKVRRLLTRLSLELLFHPFQPFVIGQKNLAPRMSIQYGIPLVFYGDHGVEWGLPLAESEQARIDYNYFTTQSETDIYLGGVSITDLKEQFGVFAADLQLYMPLDPSEIAKVGTEIHYLGYYEKWHPQANYYFAREHSDFQPAPERTPGTYSKYASIDDKVDDFNHFCYFIKFGIGRSTYDASQEVRAGDITLDEATALIRRYDGEFPTRFSEDFFKFCSIPEKEFGKAASMFEQQTMDKEYFDHLCDRFRSPHLWTLKDGQWVLRHAVWHEHD